MSIKHADRACRRPNRELLFYCVPNRTTLRRAGIARMYVGDLIFRNAQTAVTGVIEADPCGHMSSVPASAHRVQNRCGSSWGTRSATSSERCAMPLTPQVSEVPTPSHSLPRSNQKRPVGDGTKSPMRTKSIMGGRRSRTFRTLLSTGPPWWRTAGPAVSRTRPRWSVSKSHTRSASSRRPNLRPDRQTHSLL